MVNAFLGNKFETRQDVEQGIKGLLDALAPHTSPGGALITLSSSGTHYDQTACQLEAFARPLWGLVSLLQGGGSYPGTERWLNGFKNGTDPDGMEYWGETKGKDQRMVEMSPLSFGLIMAKDKLYDPLDEKSKENIQKWLGAINDKKMPDTNWLFFRVFTNLALQSLSSALFSSTQLESDLNHLDTFQLRGDQSGWSRDGPEGVVQVDYYSGSFAIMFSMMLISRVCAKSDPARCENYRKRALRFCLDLILYFDEQGRCIPFGRSMIYRFAVISTFSLLPYAFPSTSPSDSLPSDYPLSWGQIKGLVLRHLRWWGKQKGIMRSDGTLNVGYGYENMYMAENYNGFGSPYWSTKAFACLAVPPTHPFWTSTELSYPKQSTLFPSIKPLQDPLHIMINSPEPASSEIVKGKPSHRFLLSSGQCCHYPLKASEAKYGKFAYSSEFGFSVPTGSFGLEQLSADSMLALCDDPMDEGFGQGERWRVRRVPLNARIVTHGPNPWEIHLQSGWKPWPDVEVETWLLPPMPETPYWYIRVHKMTRSHGKRDGKIRVLRSSEAGWSMYGQSKDGRALVQVFSGETSTGGLETDGIARAITQGGIIGVKDLGSALLNTEEGKEMRMERRGKLIQGDANSNILTPRTVIPSLLGLHSGESESLSSGADSIADTLEEAVNTGSTRTGTENETDQVDWMITGVFGLPPCPLGEEEEYEEMWEGEWEKTPVVPDFVREMMLSGK